MPSVEQFKEAKEKIIEFVRNLLKKSEKRGAVISVQYKQLMKALIALIVFRNACRVSSAIYIQHHHYKQLARDSVEDEFSMPLAPAKLNQHVEHVYYLFSLCSEAKPNQRQWKRIAEQTRKANKNYHKGRKVLILSAFEKRLIDDFLALKEKMNGQMNENEGFIFSPLWARGKPEVQLFEKFRQRSGSTSEHQFLFQLYFVQEEVEYRIIFSRCFVSNWLHEFGKNFHSRRRTHWAQTVNNPEVQRHVNVQQEHSWATAREFYTYCDQAKSGQVVGCLEANWSKFRGSTFCLHISLLEWYWTHGFSLRFNLSWSPRTSRDECCVSRLVPPMKALVRNKCSSESFVQQQTRAFNFYFCRLSMRINQVRAPKVWINLKVLLKHCH